MLLAFSVGHSRAGTNQVSPGRTLICRLARKASDRLKTRLAAAIAGERCRPRRAVLAQWSKVLEHTILSERKCSRFNDMQVPRAVLAALIARPWALSRASSRGGCAADGVVHVRALTPEQHGAEPAQADVPGARAGASGTPEAGEETCGGGAGARHCEARFGATQRGLAATVRHAPPLRS